MQYFGCFFLDNEKDMILNLYLEGGQGRGEQTLL